MFKKARAWLAKRLLPKGSVLLDPNWVPNPLSEQRDKLYGLGQPSPVVAKNHGSFAGVDCTLVLLRPGTEFRSMSDLFIKQRLEDGHRIRACQGISFTERRQVHPDRGQEKTSGYLVLTLFEYDWLPEKFWTGYDLWMVFNNEFGRQVVVKLPNFTIIKRAMGCTIDDLMIDIQLEFEAARPVFQYRSQEFDEQLKRANSA